MYYFVFPFCFLSFCHGIKGGIVRMSLPIQNNWASWLWVKIILSKGSTVSNHNFQTTKTRVPLSIHLIYSCHNDVNSSILTKKSNKVNVSQHELSRQQYANIISKNMAGTNNADNFTCISVIADDITEAINDNNWFITATTNHNTISAGWEEDSTEDWQRKRRGRNRWTDEQRISLPTYCEYSHFNPAWSNLCACTNLETHTHTHVRVHLTALGI